MLTDFGKVHDVQTLLECAQNEAVAWPMTSIEFNVPATIIMLLDACKDLNRPVNPSSIREEAEIGMLQIALLNQAINPGSPFLVKAHAEGWRYLPHRGFFREVKNAKA